MNMHPIRLTVMTSLAFILGVLPLMLSSAETRITASGGCLYQA